MTSLLDLLDSTGTQLQQFGTKWKGRCPFHSDDDYSLIVDAENNRWQCIGACQSGGGVIEWVMRSRGISRRHAEQLLSSNSPLLFARSDSPVVASTVRYLDAPFESQNTDQEILQNVVNYYHESLKQSPQAQDYLKRRGLDNGSLIEYFKLGYSNRSLGYHLPDKNRKEGAALRGRLQRIGIIKGSGHELFHGCLIVPIMENGLVSHVYGRRLCDKVRSGTPLHYALPNPSRCFFHAKALQTCDELILTSSIIDALSFWSVGYQNVTSRVGMDTLTAEELTSFSQSSVKRLLIAYAGTKPNDAAALALAEQLTPLGIDCYRIEFPGGLDANAYALSHVSANQALGDVIRKAAWLGAGQGRPNAAGAGCAGAAKAKPPAVVDVQNNESVAPSSGNDNIEPIVLEQVPALAATVLPPVAEDVEAQVTDEEIVICFQDRRYRVRGLSKNLTADMMKINLLVNRQAVLHVDTLDLYAAKARLNFIEQAAKELGVSEDVLKKDIAKVLLKLEELQDRQIQKALTVKPAKDTMTKQEKQEALGLLQSPDLLRRILMDFDRCGIVGERTNKLMGYLAAISRKLDQPLAILIQSTSAAGKSSLMEAVLSFVPEEERAQYSAMTGQSLFYMDNINLQHKILAISEEEGASKATYALKILQSEGKLTIASTGKDPNTGRHVAREYQVEGPVMIFSTTTAIDIDEELLNRCIVLTVDEDRAQTRAIHDYQRFAETLEGLQLSQQRTDIVRVHRNAQRLLKPLKVVNPYATQLSFLDDKTRTRRDHKKYLTLIRSIALLHQYQRDLKQTYLNGQLIRYVEVTLEDIDAANQLAHEVLGRSLDELPPQTRRLLLLLDGMVSQVCQERCLSRHEYRFTRKTVREFLGWGDTQLKIHLKRLEVLEYVVLHRGNRGLRYEYELLYNREGQDGQPFLMGLMDVATLKQQNANISSTNLSKQSDIGQGLVGTKSAQCQSFENHANSLHDKDLGEVNVDSLINSSTPPLHVCDTPRHRMINPPAGGMCS